MLARTFRLQLAAVRGALMSAAIYVAALTLPGCSVLQTPEQASPVTPVPASAMQYAAWLRGLSAAERQSERLRLESTYQKAPALNPVEGVQLALLISTIKPGDNDELLLALAILTNVTSIENPADSPLNTDYAEFAQLWHSALLQQASVLTIAQERAALLERLQERNLLLNNENVRLQEQNQALLHENPLLHEEIMNLQLQIDGLKKIEQQLNQRELLQDSP
jgi:hypothetical protein